ncbi:cob(I)yrinic acid a,c-diamide adenosyltransferase [Desulfobacter hydrogenophilus]|uniref:corrinoid adenosyltransferase n=1 Tax=Desulfobacter hydrogenophilus TaxID=2291 RepID=A0A328FA67_9BACT|nr:cob(I)yrinic acid a,c-diamide adenosyltransferase [Desulfobacter hydrogenophilus]NDY74015.1 cob(I)yrinic acid a,c-diamide adenosyltransferase [Desulfobacter hydrogenophilus]QBH12720.1 cob(I)yrinic acid a,c-diamide adenosyltransferase [Desulfobacter hydrogenophilus]RAM00302.1 cob(I)yrinic acid a,c-diamide adenosyltransferase [Desulfobacter hydrogenophilus]
MKGYVQVYTGNGKGKTTASLGLALRAAGAGLKVFIVQFMKQGMYSEIKALKKFDNIVVEQYGAGQFVKEKPSDAERASCRQGYERLCRIIESGDHDLVIAEEANIACFCGLLSEEDLLHLIAIKPEHIELVITGRYAPASVMDKADLVTEMTQIKHYYQQGVEARVGIEK